VDKTEIDFGEVRVGEEKLENFSLWNAGEARAKVTMVSSNADLFPAWDPNLDVESGITTDTAVRFMPKKNGEFVATLFVASNDPNDPVQEIVLKGVAFGGANHEEDLSQESGCACRTAGSDPADRSPASPLFGLLTAAATTAFRRRRPGRN
jgi:hypothetical protein